MSKLFNKEFTIKRKAWQIILEGLLNGVIVTMVLYFLLTECGDEIIKSLTWIKEENVVLKTTLLAFPVILIITTIFKIAYFANVKMKKNN